jgi:hypothetical protein
MHQHTWKPVILAMAAFALSAALPSALVAQDHQDDHQQQKPGDHHDDHPAMQRDDHHDDNRADPVAQYRHDHPHAAARCHDGFFTSTHDHSRACTKHGGIDVWLVP